MGISAYHLLRKQHLSFFTRSFRMGLIMALISSLFVVVEGHMHGADLVHKQPAKLAALETHWETGTYAPVYLLAVPDEENAKNSIQVGRIPGALSMLAFHSPSAEVKGLRDIPRAERPPVTATFLSFRLMVTLGMLFALITIVAWFRRNKLESSPLLLKVMLCAIPFPYIACELGWTVAEVGRQPWIVYGLMKTSDAVSPVAASQVGTSLVAFVLVYSLLGLAAFLLMARAARKGPPKSAASTTAGKGV
jgi:cytochrome d ubiquinol oxidase subunit I